MENTRLMIVEDDPGLSRILSDGLNRRGMEVVLVTSGEEAIRQLAHRFHVMLLDLSLPDMGGLEVFARILEEPYAPEVVVLTGEGNVESAVETMKLGAYDYLRKPIAMERLFLTLTKAAEKCRLRFDNIHLKNLKVKADAEHGEIVIISPRMKVVMSLVNRVAATDASVLITGETGTGKDIVAMAIHQNSPRNKGPFIAINCASLQESTLESELFGHEKGAFTDAKERKLGFFEIASGGTFFMDEIGYMSLALQAKLLHALEKGTFFRVGGTRLVHTNTRVVAATNVELEKKIEEGSFRRDLYYRINMFSLELPPLRERKEEILPIAEKFLKEVGTVKRLSEESKRLLVHSNTWPGNIRELKHVVQRAALLSQGEEILPEDLGMMNHPSIASYGQSDPHSLEEVERNHILAILSLVEGNKMEASRILGISSKTLHRKIKKYSSSE